MDWWCLWRFGEIYTSPILDMENYILPGIFLFWYGVINLHPSLDLYAPRSKQGLKSR
jgi:hypothetical protein